MPLSPTARHGAHPAMVLGVHIEPLTRGRRVAILGDATIELAEQLGERGARLVHAYDPDPARAAEALARSAADRRAPGGDGGASGPRPHYAAFEGDLGVRDGAFDVIVIPDLSLFADPADVLRRARRLVPASGAVVVASPNPEVKSRLVGGSSVKSAASASPSDAKSAQALGYYELFDVVSLQFPVVRMIGQAPFVGYTVTDFALAGEPSINVDTSLLEATEQPEWFIAIGSERPVSLDEFAVIELPLADVSLAPADDDAAAEARAALADAREKLALTTAELETLRDRQRDEARDADSREKSSAAMSARLVELEGELAAREARFKEIQLRAGDSHVRAERLTHQITDLEEEVRRQRDRATKLAKQLDDEKKARTKSDMELAMIRNKPEIAGAKDRLQELAGELEAARGRIAELEVENQNLLQAQAEAAEAHPAPLSELSVVVPDVGLVNRVAELEIALQEARHALAEASSKGVDASLRADALQATLAEERRASADLGGRSREANEARASLTEKVAELSRKSADLEKRAATLEQQNAELSRRNGELEKRAADLLRQQDEAVAAALPDLTAAESLLRERGRLIASLQRDLRESERIGRELVEELGSLRDSLDEAPAPALAPAAVAMPETIAPPTIIDREVVQDLRARLNALASRSAKSEADLQAASWRITQLERDLAEAQAPAPAPSAAIVELEQALASARAEIAALREGSAADISRAAVEQSVLLHQAAGEIAGQP